MLNRFVQLIVRSSPFSHSMGSFQSLVMYENVCFVQFSLCAFFFNSFPLFCSQQAQSQTSETQTQVQVTYPSNTHADIAPSLFPSLSRSLLTLFFYCIINLIFLCNVCITVRFYYPSFFAQFSFHSIRKKSPQHAQDSCVLCPCVPPLSCQLLELVLANFCCLEVSPPRAKGIIFFLRLLFPSKIWAWLGVSKEGERETETER